jgi:hypothetical protein
MRLVAGALLLVASLPVGGYGLLYLGAISTSDSSPGSLAMVGGLLLLAAIGLIGMAVWLIRSDLSSRSAR